MSKWVVFPALLLAAVQAQAQFVNSSLEQYSYQIGDAQLEVRSYDGFDEFEDVANLANFSQYDFRVSGGAWETINYSTQYEMYKRGIQYPTLAAMLAARPNDGTYEHRVTRTDASTATISISGDRPDYNNAIPNDPLFTIGNVNGGGWSRNGGDENTGVFTFDPSQFADGQSFTVQMNAYAGPTTGPGQASAAFVADIATGVFTEIDEAVLINVPQWGETADVSVPITLTFTKGAGPLDAGDNDPTTFMFQNGSRFELEGEHVNLYSLEDASAELGLAPDSAAKGFIYQTVTSFILVADASSGIPGDFDGDGDVDGVDIAEMFSNFNGPGGGVPANPDTDLDGDGDVDGVDIASLFGAFTGPLAPANVPEPTSLALLGLLAVRLSNRGGVLIARRRL